MDRVVELGTLAFHASHPPSELVAWRIGDNMTARTSTSGTSRVRMSIGASIGIAAQRTSADSGGHLRRAADVAMYAAKGQGKHRFQRFDADVHGPVADVTSSMLTNLRADDFGARPT